MAVPILARAGIVPLVGGSPSAPLITRGSRVIELDGLRFVLVVAILFTHAGIGEGGWAAVDTFFMLSGFLIGGLLISDAHRPQAIRTFLSRRFRRLLPAFLVCVMIVSGLLLTGLVSVTGPADQPLRQAFWSVLYVGNWYELTSGANYWGQFGRSPFGHLWSLSIEEQFYLVFPVVMVAIRRIRPAGQIGVLGGLALASGSWALFLGLTGTGIDRIYYGTDTRAFALLLGATAALATARPAVRSWLLARPLGTTVTGTAALVGLFVINATVRGGDPSLYRGGFQVTTIIECLLVVSLACGNLWLRPVLGWRPLVWLGERSYSIYLWHMPVFALAPGAAQHPWRTLLLGTPVAIALGAVSYSCIELAFLRQPTRRPSLRFASTATMAVVATLALSAGGLAWASSAAARPHQVLRSAAAMAPAPLAGIDLAAVAGRNGDFVEAAPTTLAPVKSLMVLGDSMAVTFANTMQIPGMPVINNGQIGCGSLSMDRGLIDGQWQRRAAACAVWRNSTWTKPLQQVDATLWMWGAWDLADADVGGRQLLVGTPEYEAWLRSELTRAADQLTTEGRRLFITSALCFDDRDVKGMNLRAAVQNDIISSFALSRPGVTYLPLIDFLCDDGSPVLVNGEAPRPDGVHFSQATSVLVWSWLLPYLRGTKTGADPTARIDQS